MPLKKHTLSNRPIASIILLTRNSSKTIGNVLEGILRQNFKKYEIILIDSTSTDDTVKIAKKFPCKIVKISPNDFGHGKTRNYAASLANGEFVIFLTHDSVPERPTWLEEMLKPFKNKKIIGVYGRQVPRPDENTLDRYFQASLYGEKPLLWQAHNWQQGDNLFSDANSIVRRSLLIKYPYPDNIIVSEDYAWAVQVLGLGHNISYSPEARVIHSHSYNLRTLFQRNFDVGVSYKSIFGRDSSGSFVRKGVKIVFSEIKYLATSGHTGLIPLALLRDLIRFVAIFSGKHEQWFSKEFIRKYLTGQKWYWK